MVEPQSTLAGDLARVDAGDGDTSAASRAAQADARQQPPCSAMSAHAGKARALRGPTSCSALTAMTPRGSASTGQ